MVMDLFVSTSSKICSESGEGWAVLTLVSFECKFTPKDRTLRGRLGAPKGFWGFQKSSCNNQNSVVFSVGEGALKKIHSSLNRGDGKSVGFTVSCPWTVLVASKMRKFTSEFYKVVNYSGNILFQVKNVIFTDWGLFFLEAPWFEAVEQFIFLYENNNLIFPYNSWDCLEEVVTCALEFRPVKPLTLYFKWSSA